MSTRAGSTMKRKTKGSRRPQKRSCPFVLGEAIEARRAEAEDEAEEAEEDDDEPGLRDEAEEREGGEASAAEEQVEDSEAGGSAGLEDSDDGDEQLLVDPSPSLYRRLDNERRQSEWPCDDDDDDDDDDEVASYFPVALAVSPERPLEFNFDLFLFDRMRLERGLFPEDQAAPVEFPSHEACRAYCTRYVRVVLEQADQQAPNPSGSNSAHRLDKHQLFVESGSSLADQLRTGDDTCDMNLERVRRDRYGNVMVWGAPAWSDLCPNFMHGYPRRLVHSTEHGGFLPGNICVAARVSNVAMRSIAPGDVAAFCSKQAIQNLGLTVSELFLARRSALSYAGQARQPQRLVQTMLRFGIDLLTFAPLSRETLGKLREAAHIVERQNHLDFSPSSEQLASSQASTDVEEESTPSDPNQAIDLDASAVVSRLSEEQRNQVQTASYSLDVVMWRHFIRPAVPPAATPTRGDPHHDPELGGDGRPPQRRAAADAAAQTSHAVLSGASSGRSGRRRAARAGDAGGSTAHAESDDALLEETLRGRLARVPRVNVIHVPKSAALRPVREFLLRHQPIARQEIEERSRTLPGGEWAGVASAIHREHQMAVTRSALQDIWSIAKRDCTCLAAGSLNNEDAAPSENCPFRTSDGSGQQIDPTSTACRATGCGVCDFFTNRYRDIVDMSASAGLDKASRFRALLAIASYLVPIVSSDSFATVDEQQRLKAILERVMSCRTDKLNSILAVGYLAHTVPRVAQVHLTSGWSDFWREMRKFGNALRHQPDRRAQIAVLQFMRATCVPPGSKWAYFLTLEEEVAAASNPLLVVEPSDEENVVPLGGSSPQPEE